MHNLDLCPRYGRPSAAACTIAASAPALAAASAAATSAPACNGTGCRLHHGHGHGPHGHGHHGHGHGHHTDVGVAAPGTPDPSEKDTDGDSDDLVLEAPCACDEMEGAMQQLIAELGENPTRPGLAGSARRYVMSLLASTSGYTQQPAVLGASMSVSAGASASAAATAGYGLEAAAGSGANVGAASARPAGCSRCCCAGELASAHAEQEQDLEGSGCSSRTASGPQAGSGPLRGVVTLRLPFSSQCEHHMLPFYGELLIAYIADDSSASSSSLDASSEAASGPVSCSGPQPLPRSAVEQVVSTYTQRLQVQERITHQVADAVEALLRQRQQQPAQQQQQQEQQGSGLAGGAEDAGCAGGVMVVCDAAHMCMVARGVENHSGSTTSFAVRGAFASRPDMRRAVLRLFREKQ